MVSAGFSDPSDAVAPLPDFPEANLLDAAIDYVKDDEYASRRAEELQMYLQDLFGTETGMLAEDVLLDALLEELCPKLSAHYRADLLVEISEVCREIQEDNSGDMVGTAAGTAFKVAAARARFKNQRKSGRRKTKSERIDELGMWRRQREKTKTARMQAMKRDAEAEAKLLAATLSLAELANS